MSENEVWSCPSAEAACVCVLLTAFLKCRCGTSERKWRLELEFRYQEGLATRAPHLTLPFEETNVQRNIIHANRCLDNKYFELAQYSGEGDYGPTLLAPSLFACFVGYPFSFVRSQTMKRRWSDACWCERIPTSGHFIDSFRCNQRPRTRNRKTKIRSVFQIHLRHHIRSVSLMANFSVPK